MKPRDGNCSLLCLISFKTRPFFVNFSHCAWERQVTEELFFASIKNASLLREVRVNTRDVMTEAYHHIFRENGSQNPIKTNNQASAKQTLLLQSDNMCLRTDLRHF